MSKKFIIQSLFSIALILLPLAVNAWTVPSQAPTGGNTTGPLNVSSGVYTKAGGVILNSGGALYGLLVAYGGLGIGTLTPINPFEIWNVSLGILTVTSAGRVGVGTQNPASSLSISGGLQIGTDSAACTTAKAGTIRWQSSALQFCDGTSWANL